MNIINRLVVKNLILNKKRTIVSIIGILLAVALLTALFTLAGSFRNSIIEREKEQEGNYHIQLFDVPLEEVERLRQNRNINNLYTQIDLGYAVLEGSENVDKPYAYVISSAKEALEETPIELHEGRLPENSSEIVISRHVNTNGRVGIKVGDTLTLNIGHRACEKGQDITRATWQYYYYGELGEEYIADTEERTYTVVGIINRPSYKIEPYSAPGYTCVTINDDNTGREQADRVYIEYTQAALANVSEISAGILGVEEYKELFAGFNDIDTGARNDFTENDWNTYMDEVLPKIKYNWEFNTWLIRYQRIWPIDSMFIILFIIAGIVGMIIVATSIYCIKNSFEISVSEKIRLYGMLAGIGATRKQIKKSVLFEAMAEGAVGIPLGLGLGLLASYILSAVSNSLLRGIFDTDNLIKLNISWIPIAISVLMGIITIYLSSIGATIKAGKITPIDAIRNSTEIKLTAKSVKAPKVISKVFGVGGTVAYKNIKRNKRKYRTTVVSIAICTITFIVTSYFISLIFGVTENIYSSDEANVDVSIYEAQMTYEQVAKYFDKFDDQKQVEYVSYNSVFIENAEYTNNYLKFFEISEDEYEEYANPVAIISVWILDDESFARYLQRCHKSVKDGQVVFYNYCKVQGEGTVRMFDYENDTLSVHTENYDNVELDENNCLIEDTIEYYYMNIPVGVEVDEVPMGLVAQSSNPAIIMSCTTFDMLGIEDKLGFGRTVSEIYFESKNADKLQDDIEAMFEQEPDVFYGGFGIYNRDQNAREEKSLYTLISIFAYGFIIVIALIGITNIVNTLGTSMELRARDFATLRSIGMTKGQFTGMIWLESIFTSAKSLIIGTVIGLGITVGIWWFENNYDMAISYKPPVTAVLICITVVIILVYFIISTNLNKINKRNIIETIKNENM